MPAEAGSEAVSVMRISKQCHRDGVEIWAFGLALAAAVVPVGATLDASENLPQKPFAQSVEVPANECLLLR